MRTSRSRRTDPPTSEVPRPPVPVTTAAELPALVAALPEHSDSLELTVRSLDEVRLLTLAPPHLTLDRLEIQVADWTPPLAGWSGRLGPLTGVRSCEVTYPDDDTERVRVTISVARPTALAALARGIYPLLGIDRGRHGYAQVELGTADLPPAGLGLLPTPTAPGVPEVPSIHLEGVGLSRADLGLVGDAETLDALEATADDPELIVFGQSLLVDRSGHLAVTERLERPLVDLNVHNPVGRLFAFDRPVGRVALTLDSGTLGFDVLPQPPAPVTERPRAQRSGGRKNPDTASAEPEQDPVLEGWSRPAAAALSGSEVLRLRDVEDLDLSRLAPGSPDQELEVYRRLAELAATGVVLHSLPPTFLRADDVLGTTLAESLRAPYRPSTGLVRDLRTVPQRREAMKRFGGFLELAAHAAPLGHRLLPSVSVVLSSMRPNRVAAVLTALAAQTYPHLEIAVALHGVESSPGAEFDEAVRLSGATVVRQDSTVPFGTVLASTALATSGDLVVKIDDDDVYGPRVIEDLVLAYLYSNADVVGKTTEYLYFEDIDHTAHRTFQTERYHTQVAGGAMMLSRAALTEIGGWRPSKHSTDRSVLIRIGNSGGICYRTQSLGYVYVRHSDGHTWKQMDSMLLRNTPEQWPRFMPEIVDA